MRVLILWADDSSPNLGVRVLGRGTEALVRRNWPEAEIVFENYGLRAPELPFGRLRDLARERLGGRLGMMRWLRGFDLVVDTRSGDSFADIYGLHRLAIMTSVASLAASAGVPVVLGPQTIGPFETRRGRMLARRSLRQASLVMARDPESESYARGLGFAPDLLTSDVVFALPVPTVAPGRDVVLNISGLLWQQNPHVDSARYRADLTRLYRRLEERGRGVTLLAHVLDSPNADNDVRAIEEFVRLTAPDASVVIPSGLDEVRTTVASARLVIGSRMHACLNALSVGTPAIPLAYSRKFAPLLQSLGWNHTVELGGPADIVASVEHQLDNQSLADDAARVVERGRASLEPVAAALAGVVGAGGAVAGSVGATGTRAATRPAPDARIEEQ